MLNIKKWMAKVSERLSRHIYTADYVNNSVVASGWTATRQIRRIGNLAVFTFNGRITGSLAASTEVTIAKINDSAYLPYGNTVYMNIPTQDNQGTVMVQVKTTGDISIYAHSGITAPSFARAQIVYFCQGGG